MNEWTSGRIPVWQRKRRRNKGGSTEKANKVCGDWLRWHGQNRLDTLYNNNNILRLELDVTEECLSSTARSMPALNLGRNVEEKVKTTQRALHFPLFIYISCIIACDSWLLFKELEIHTANEGERMTFNDVRWARSRKSERGRSEHWVLSIAWAPAWLRTRVEWM